MLYSLVCPAKLAPYSTIIRIQQAAAVAQWVRAFAPQAEGWEFESQPQLGKSGSDSSTAKLSAIGVSVIGPRRYHYKRMSCVKVGLAH